MSLFWSGCKRFIIKTLYVTRVSRVSIRLVAVRWLQRQSTVQFRLVLLLGKDVHTMIGTKLRVEVGTVDSIYIRDSGGKHYAKTRKARVEN